MRTRRNRVGWHSNTDRSREAYTSSTRVRYGVFAKRGPRCRSRDQKRRGVLVSDDWRCQSADQACEDGHCKAQTIVKPGFGYGEEISSLKYIPWLLKDIRGEEHRVLIHTQLR